MQPHPIYNFAVVSMNFLTVFAHFQIGIALETRLVTFNGFAVKGCSCIGIKSPIFK